MRQDLGDGREGGDRNRAVYLERAQQRGEVAILPHRDPVVAGDRDDLQGERAATLGDHPGSLGPVGVVAERDGEITVLHATGPVLWP